MNNTLSQNITIASGKYDHERDYWLNKLSGELVIKGFPFDHPQIIEEMKNETISFNLSDENFQKINKISKGSEHATFMILFAAVNCLLFKYTRSEDLLIAVPILRQKVESEYLNHLLVLRTQIKQEMTFKDLLLQARQIISEANEYPNYPIYKIIELLEIPVKDRFPLSKVMVMMENIHDYKYIANEKCDTLFSFRLTEKSLEGSLTYDSSIYREETIEQLIRHLISFIEIATEKVNIMLSEIDLLSQEEKEQQLFTFNDTHMNISKEKTIYQLFEEQSEKTPDAIAIVFEDKQITYQELNEKSNQLARLLREKGVRPEEIIGIMVTRSLEMAIGILAILKAGGAYLPLDPHYPEERINYILKDTATDIILTQSHLIRDEFTGIMINLDDNQLYSGDYSNLESVNKPKDLAYIIYTSGSTGKPKGVMIEHHSISNTIQWRKNEYQMIPEDRILQLFSFLV